MNSTINWKMIGLGLLFIVGGIFAFGAEHLTWEPLIIIAAGVIIMWLFGRDPRYYCADCGQYVGSGSDTYSVCPRCGCNVFTRGFNGVGRTTRNR